MIDDKDNSFNQTNEIEKELSNLISLHTPGRIDEFNSIILKLKNETKIAYQKAADEGNSRAQFIIGLFYENGLGVEKDYQKAMEWYEKSANQCNSNAQNNINRLHENGQEYTKKITNEDEEFSSKELSSSLSQFKCKYHGFIQKHDIFISYRVFSEKDVSQKLFLGLKEFNYRNKKIKTFLDKYCLNHGNEFTKEFTNAIQNCSIIILLISEDSIKGIENAFNKQDNVLLEFEISVKRYLKGECHVLPIYLGKHIDTPEYGKVYKKFNDFDILKYPQSFHFCEESPQYEEEDNNQKTIREVMKIIFSINEETRIHIDPELICDNEIIEKQIMKLLITPLPKNMK